jgi:hypothetical protein
MPVSRAALHAQPIGFVACVADIQYCLAMKLT